MGTAVPIADQDAQTFLDNARSQAVEGLKGHIPDSMLSFGPESSQAKPAIPTPSTPAAAEPPPIPGPNSQAIVYAAPPPPPPEAAPAPEQPGFLSEEFKGIGRTVMIPIVLSVFSAIVLRRLFVPTATPRPKTAHTSRIPTLLQTPISWSWNSFKHLPEAWLGGITLLGLFYAAVFPPWVFEVRGFRRALGSGVIYDPPSYGGSDAYVHIDSGLLAAHCLGIAALGGIAILLAYVYRRQRPIQTTVPTTLLDRTLDIAGKIVVTGYRNLAAQHGCAPTQATSDQQIMEIYSKVGTAFKDVARERGEELQAGWLNTVALKFLQVKEKMGEVFMDEHLSYELDKYRQEGLRSDYKKDLQLF